MRALLLALGFMASGCLAPPPASERVTDAARQLNLAARFGRMDVALELTAKTLQPKFLERRAQWGKEVRILDVELTGFAMPNTDHAQVEVDYAWSRITESQLRTTRIAQEWQDRGGGFRLVREHRVSGDLGLFGEPVPEMEKAAPRDVQYATKVIR